MREPNLGTPQPLARRSDLARAVLWACELVTSGLADPTCTPNPGYRTWTLRLVPRGETAALITLWNDHTVPALAIEDGVLRRVAPDDRVEIERHAGADQLGRGKSRRVWDDTLLAALRTAFVTAARSALSETAATMPPMARVFGHIPGIAVGMTFASRRALANAGVHRPLQHGISGAGDEGADSIVVSGGYEDDKDFGDLIVYTGAGGRDPGTGQQTADQAFTAQNLALVKSEAEGLPVRVARGSADDPAHSPVTGFRYDGLYRVEESWREPGSRASSCAGTDSCGWLTMVSPVPIEPGTVPRPASREQVTIQRLVRSTGVSEGQGTTRPHMPELCRTDRDRLRRVLGGRTHSSTWQTARRA